MAPTHYLSLQNNLSTIRFIKFFGYHPLSLSKNKKVRYLIIREKEPNLFGPKNRTSSKRMFQPLKRILRIKE